ncbi:hypothetical protein ABPG77_008885 [Micractinium sp. CCAP 211/92]
MGARVLARLGACAAAEAAAHPACFDAAVTGVSLWVAARSDERSVTVVHAPAQHARGRAASSGSLHALVSLPEPVALAQLGAVHAAAEGPGSAVLLLVGASCRVWAFQLRPPARSSRIAQPGPPIEVAAAESAAVAVPLAHPACPAKHQLAAAVAWEHLAFSWDPAAVSQHTSACGGGGRGSVEARSGWDSTGGQGGVVPLPLDKLAAALQRYRSHGQLQDDQMPLLVHSIASWVCQLPAPTAGSSAAAAPAIPADATAAAYVGVNADGSGAVARLSCQARFELPPAACSQTPTSAVGHLLVATSLTAAADGQQRQQLVVLTSQGALLSVSAADLSTSQPAAEVQRLLTVQAVESSIQGLLGSIAGMSEQQEALDRQLLALDARLAGLAAAIPAAQAAASAGIGAAAVGGGRLHCTVRPLKLRSQTLRCRAGSHAVGDGSSEDELALEVGLRNNSMLPLAGSWSVLITYTPSHGSSGSSIAFADALGGLQPRAEWRREFALPLARGLSGHLRVLLCLHADAAAGSSPDSAALSRLGTEER